MVLCTLLLKKIQNLKDDVLLIRTGSILVRFSYYKAKQNGEDL